MKLILLFYIFIQLFTKVSASTEICNIFIHGHTVNSKNYWGDVERQVRWDSNLGHKEAAIEVAKKILIFAKTCENKPMVLRAHSYGAAVTFYILGQGNRFSKLLPNHDFVKVQQLTMSFYSYSGAYKGTPLMDLICSNNTLEKLTSKFGKSCVKSLTTKSIFHPSNDVSNPGVPIYLIYTSNRHAYANTSGTIISTNGISFWDWIKGKRNQNDSVLPTYSTRACSSTEPLTKEEQNCEKIDPNYFIDFMYEPSYTHSEYLNDKKFILEEAL